jgi:hypothetical protein
MPNQVINSPRGLGSQIGQAAKSAFGSLLQNLERRQGFAFQHFEKGAATG